MVQQQLQTNVYKCILIIQYSTIQYNSKQAQHTRWVQNTVSENRWITASELQHKLSLTNGMVVSITEGLEFQKACEWWVLKTLSEAHKLQRMPCVISFLQQNAVSCHKFFEHSVTGDETWVHHHALETKCSTMECKHPGPPRMNKFKVHQENKTNWCKHS